MDDARTNKPGHPEPIEYEPRHRRAPGRTERHIAAVLLWGLIVLFVILTAYALAGHDLLSSVHPQHVPWLERIAAAAGYVVPGVICRLLIRRLYRNAPLRS